VIRGQEEQWRAGLNPWAVSQEGSRIYGRGTADNKGQHTINLAAIEAVLRTRGKLGFNLKVLIETGEEMGSPGLKAFCEQNRDALRADGYHHMMGVPATLDAAHLSRRRIYAVPELLVRLRGRRCGPRRMLGPSPHRLNVHNLSRRSR
jgi:acetylornithine deacetylase/succinyl-diaminopimelate desuccinylase-like protein